MSQSEYPDSELIALWRSRKEEIIRDFTLRLMIKGIPFPVDGTPNPNPDSLLLGRYSRRLVKQLAALSVNLEIDRTRDIDDYELDCIERDAHGQAWLLLHLAGEEYYRHEAWVLLVETAFPGDDIAINFQGDFQAMLAQLDAELEQTLGRHDVAEEITMSLIEHGYKPDADDLIIAHELADALVRDFDPEKPASLLGFAERLIARWASNRYHDAWLSLIEELFFAD